MRRPTPGQPTRGSQTGKPLMVLFDLLGRRWTLRVLWELRTTSLGFRTLQERCDQMSSSVLRDRLAELVDTGFVQTDDVGLYQLTSQGVGLLRALGPLSKWADDWGGGTRRSPLSGWK